MVIIMIIMMMRREPEDLFNPTQSPILTKLVYFRPPFV